MIYFSSHLTPKIGSGSAGSNDRHPCAELPWNIISSIPLAELHRLGVRGSNATSESWLSEEQGLHINRRIAKSVLPSYGDVTLLETSESLVVHQL